MAHILRKRYKNKNVKIQILCQSNYILAFEITELLIHFMISLCYIFTEKIFSFKNRKYGKLFIIMEMEVNTRNIFEYVFEIV